MGLLGGSLGLGSDLGCPGRRQVCQERGGLRGEAFEPGVCHGHLGAGLHQLCPKRFGRLDLVRELIGRQNLSVDHRGPGLGAGVRGCGGQGQTADHHSQRNAQDRQGMRDPTVSDKQVLTQSLRQRLF